MARPPLLRRIGCPPLITHFKPVGVEANDLPEIIVSYDEFEAIRLKHFLNIDQTQAAKRMNISQPTFHRLIKSAQRKIAEALINGRAIKIEGGHVFTEKISYQETIKIAICSDDKNLNGNVIPFLKNLSQKFN